MLAVVSEVRSPAADQDGVDPDPVLVDQAEVGGIGSQIGTTDRDVAVTGRTVSLRA